MSDDFEPASADTPLGMLQRGRGAGFLWALGHASEARPLLVECITHDPRRDRQIESRAPYYAQIALAVGLELAPLERHLREHDDANENGYRSALAVYTLGEMARRGSREALRLLRDYVAYGAHWTAALHDLFELANGGEPEAREAIDALHPVVRGRLPTREAVAATIDRTWPDYLPWRQWATNDAVIAAALAEPRPRFPRKQARQTKLGNEESAHLLEAARHGSVSDQAAALIELGMRGDARLLEPALALLPSVPQPPAASRLRTAILRALSKLPAVPGLVKARDWYQSGEFVLRSAAERIFANHATAEDAPMLREGARRAFEEDDDYRICNAMDALARMPVTYPEVATVFEGARYSRARADAAAALAATDPAFPSGRAFECLWDCDGSIRELGCTYVDRALPGARERLLAMASDPLESDAVRKAAAITP